MPNAQATPEVSHDSQAVLETSLNNQATPQVCPSGMATSQVSPKQGASDALPVSEQSETDKDTETPNQANTSDSAFQANILGTENTPVLDNNGYTTPSAHQVLMETQQHTADKVTNGSDQQPQITPAHTDSTANIGASPSAQSNTIVPGLSDISADELTAALGSGVAPAPNVGTLMVYLPEEAEIETVHNKSLDITELTPVSHT